MDDRSRYVAEGGGVVNPGGGALWPPADETCPLGATRGPPSPCCGACIVLECELLRVWPPCPARRQKRPPPPRCGRHTLGRHRSAPPSHGETRRVAASLRGASVCQTGKSEARTGCTRAYGRRRSSPPARTPSPRLSSGRSRAGQTLRVFPARAPRPPAPPPCSGGCPAYGS